MSQIIERGCHCSDCKILKVRVRDGLKSWGSLNSKSNKLLQATYLIWTVSLAIKLNRVGWRYLWPHSEKESDTGFQTFSGDSAWHLLQAIEQSGLGKNREEIKT